MIKVIDGKRYDSQKAKCVYEWSNSYMPSDFHYRSRELYLTKKGAWFMLHEGGALSDMAVSVQGGSGGSANIEALCAEDAFNFLEQNSDDHDAQVALDKYFSDRIEDA